MSAGKPAVHFSTRIHIRKMFKCLQIKQRGAQHKQIQMHRNYKLSGTEYRLHIQKCIFGCENRHVEFCKHKSLFLHTSRFCFESEFHISHNNNTPSSILTIFCLQTSSKKLLQAAVCLFQRNNF